MVNDQRLKCTQCRRRRFVEFTPGSAVCNGCVAKQAKSTNQIELRIPAYLQAGGATTELMRQQLVETVIDSVFSPGKGDVGHMSMLGRMRDTDVQHSPLLRYAMEAVIFSQLSSQCQDQAVALGQLQQRAQRAYSFTIGHLATVAQPGAVVARRTPARSVLFSIMLMGYPPVCQQFKASSLVHQDLHIRGQYSYLSACGPAGFDWTSKDDVDFYRQLNWTLAFTQAVQFRNAMELKLPTWKPDFQAMIGFGFAAETVMLPFTITKVPQLLLQVDRASTPHSKWNEAELYRLDGRLRHALSSITGVKKLPEGWPSHEIVGEVRVTQDRHEFDERIEEHLFMITQDTIPTFFRFRPQHSPYPHDPSIHVAWVVQILLISSILRLQSSVSLELGQDIADLRNWAQQRAKDLCRSVWYLSRTAGIAHARWVQVLLRVSETIFQQVEDTSLLAWTRGCLTANRIRIDQLKKKSTSFCMVGEMMGRLPARCRWRSNDKITEIG